MSNDLDMIITSDDGDRVESVSFSVPGAPKCQNGWKVRWRGLRFPIIYDPKRQEKLHLKQQIRLAIADLLGMPQPYTPFGVFKTNMIVVFYMKTATAKDLDNMLKFLLDALKGVIYQDDRFIFKLSVSKEVANANDGQYTSVFVSKMV